MPRPGNSKPIHGGDLGMVAPLSMADLSARAAAPDPRDVVEERFEITAQKEASTKLLADRDRQEAARVNIPLDVWQDMPEDARERILRRPHTTSAPPDPPDPRGLPTLNLSDTVSTRRLGTNAPLSQDDFNRMTDALLRNDPMFSNDARGADKYTYLCAPPVRLTIDGVPGTYQDIRLVPVVDMDKKLRQGWTAYPRYPEPPTPHYPCKMTTELVTGVGGKPCPYQGYTANEVETHMKFTHPTEYGALLLQLERERQEAALAAQREQNELMRQLLERGINAPLPVPTGAGV